MSASLVGSEMCIRDSPSLEGRGASSPSGPRNMRLERGAVMSEGPGAKSACLLYTSDAADDM
eukprot:4814372-Alexandrium_andersonii.AAC.1